MHDQRPTLGLLLGDPSGIGPEVGAKLLSRYADERASLVVVTAPAVWARGLAQAGIPDPALPVLEHWDRWKRNPVSPVLWPLPDGTGDLPCTAQVSPAAGRYCLQSLQAAVALVQQGRLDGFTYAPMNKRSLQLGGSTHPDDMGLLSDLFALDQPGSEINVMDELCTARVTSHIPLAEVPAQVTAPAVLEAIRRLNWVLTAIGVSCPQLAVAGLNPHAGEGGLFGDEEVEVLAPAIAQAQAQGIAVTGPVPPDTVFVRACRGEFGGVVTMYHDQGQIAMKLLGFERGVTLAAGLPVPVTTTAHGTAFDITGTGQAHPGSLVHALKICIAQSVRTRKMPRSA